MGVVGKRAAQGDDRGGPLCRHEFPVDFFRLIESAFENLAMALRTSLFIHVKTYGVNTGSYSENSTLG